MRDRTGALSMADARSAQGSGPPVDRTGTEAVEERNGREAAVSPAIADTFRTLGLDSADARARFRQLAAPGVVDIGNQGDEWRIDTSNNTWANADSDYP